MVAPPDAAGSPAVSPQPPPPTGTSRHFNLTLATAVAGAGAVAGYMAWTSTGSRLMLFLGVAAAVALGLDVAVAMVVTRRTVVSFTSGPRQAFVGDSLDLIVAVTGPPLPTRVTVGSGAVPALAADPPQSGVVRAGADRRGLLVEVLVEVTGPGLCGLVGQSRRQLIPLRHPVAVGPRPLAPPHPLPEPPSGWGEGRPRSSVVGDVVMGVRPYVPGDPLRRIHWPATARADELVVKEVAEPVSTRLVLALDLGAGGDGAEQAARRAAWYGREALGRGYELVFVTVERARTVVDVAGSENDLHLRLARAQTGRPTLPERGAPLGGPHVFVVSAEGDEWR